MSKKNVLLFRDTFCINNMDKDGKKFLRESLEMELTIDINIELYPLDIGDKVNVILTTSLSPELTIQPEDISIVAPTEESSSSEQKVSWREKERRSKVAVYISYGGLLMSLEGDFRHVQNLHVGQQVYLLMKRVF
ncbi:1157_t:CDS:2 [Diversispora eburnea]|uniref:DNA-directed RNA polymerases I, II, and III subunit RPABC3 n=1 Tax=Diversispora eburnea TaxID=1213867 RepID=A0A9N9BB66_9GLOM|nr:1157_t:CDS:2 [Diversispora eburnea]